MAGVRGNRFLLSFRGQLPSPDAWKHFRRYTLDDIGKKGAELTRQMAPSGYHNLKGSATYKIVNASHRPDRDGDRADLRPREGGRAHNLYHIAAFGRGVSVAGFTRFGAKSSNGKTGKRVLSDGSQVYGTMSRGYKGNRYPFRVVSALYNPGARIMVENFEELATKGLRRVES